jgi:branched-chain amino acid aminotransferase
MLYLNNKLVSKGKALISVFDHGFLYGDGIYETLRAYNGVVFKLDDHIDRLFRSASMIGLTIPRGTDAIKKKCLHNTKCKQAKRCRHKNNRIKGRRSIRFGP